MVVIDVVKVYQKNSYSHSLQMLFDAVVVFLF